MLIMGSLTDGRITRGQWMALLAALLGWMFDGFEMGIFPLVARPALIELIPGLAEDAQLLKSADAAVKQEAKQRVDRQVGPWMGQITAAFLLGAALGGWTFGWLGDRIGRVRAMIFSVLTYALFTGLCGLAANPWHLMALRFLSALGMGGEWALGVALVMETWPGEKRPLLAGLIGAAANVGYVLTVVLVMSLAWGGLHVADGGWRWVLGACAFPALLTFLIRMFVPESEKWEHAVQSGPKPGVADIFTPQLRARTLIGGLLGGVALLGTWGSVQWIPQWANQITNDQYWTNIAQLWSSLGAVAGAFLGAVLGQYFPRRSVYFALCLGSLLACALLFRGFEGTTEVGTEFFATVFVVGACTAAFYGWLPLYLPELFPTRVRATGQGFSFNAGRIIAAVGALGMGYLMRDVFHGSYSRAGATISLIYVVGLFVIWLAPETKGQPLPE
jgi:SHS family sialic acid transporter-like MFS transporter